MTDILFGAQAETYPLPRGFSEEDEGRTLASFQAEIAKLNRPHPHGGAVHERTVGGTQRLRQIQGIIAYMRDRNLAAFEPPKPGESNYARLARESIEAEDAREIDRFASEPVTDLDQALSRREKALAQMDKGLDLIGKAVQAIRGADNAILELTRGHVDKDTRANIGLGHVAERLMRRLGDCGLASDLRDDTSQPSPALVELASIHGFIREQMKGTSDDGRK